MKLYARYVGWVYIKSFLIVFLALELFYVGIDLLTNLKDLPPSANLQLLYVGLTALSAISYVLPLSLIFALIILHVNMVRSNELISFYALGISKNKLILPPFLIAFFVTIFYVGLNFTPFAYAHDYQKSIAKNTAFSKSTNDSFLKFEGKFIYIKELNSAKQRANDVRIFDINGTDLLSTTFADHAKFKDNEWVLEDVNQTFLPQNLELGENGFSKVKSENLDALRGFKPKSIESAASVENSKFNIPDAINFIKTFKNEGIGLDSARTAFYNLAITPFFAPFLLLIFYYHLPVTGRFFNLALSTFIFVVITLVVWGFLFILTKFAQTSVILPEIGMVLPVILLFAYAIYLIKSHR